MSGQDTKPVKSGNKNKALNFMCKLNSIVMTKDCSRKKKKIRILPLQEFVNPSSKAEMEITKFHSLLSCKSPHLNGKASSESHKASARVCILCCHYWSEGLLGMAECWGHLKGRISMSTCFTKPSNKRACAVLMKSPQMPPSLFSRLQEFCVPSD